MSRLPKTPVRRFTVPRSIRREVETVSDEESVEIDEAARLLIKLGLRAYREGRGLFCGFENCTRRSCCGGRPQHRTVVSFQQHKEK